MSAAKRRKLDVDSSNGGSSIGPRGAGSRQRAAAAKAATVAQAAATAIGGPGRSGQDNGIYVPIVS